MGKKLKAKKPVKTELKKKVLINVKIFPGEKNALKAQANRYSKGNVTKLIRLLAHGKFKPASGNSAKKAA